MIARGRRSATTFRSVVVAGSLIGALGCGGKGGSGPTTPPPGLSLTITAAPTSVQPGGTSTITWSSSGATSCTVSPPGWTGISGSQSTGPLTTSASYTLTCTGAHGATSTATATVEVVGGEPSVEIVGDPSPPFGSTLVAGKALVQFQLQGTAPVGQDADVTLIFLDARGNDLGGSSAATTTAGGIPAGKTRMIGVRATFALPGEVVTTRAVLLQADPPFKEIVHRDYRSGFHVQ